MRKLLLAVLPLVTALCAIVPSAAARAAETGRLAWRALGPLDLGRYRLPANVMALAIDPASSGTVYAGATVFVPGMVRGVTFKSVDAGSTWAILRNGLNVGDVDFQSPPPVTDFAFDPADPLTVYAALQQSGVFKSTDAGESWSGTNRGLSAGGFVNRVAVDRFSPAVVYAATPAGVFKSEDGGVSWRPASSGLAFPFVVSLLADAGRPSTVLAGTLGGGVYETTDAGSSWFPANNGLTEPDVRALAQAPATPRRIYAGAGNGRVFRSEDGGETWTGGSLGVAADVVSLAVAPGDPARVYAATSGAGVFRSNDGGATWTAINEGLTDGNATSIAIAPSSPPRVYVGTRAGVFVLEDTGAFPIPPERTPSSPRPVGFRSGP